MWDRTKGSVGVKAISAVTNTDIYLNTRNPNIKSIRDFTDKDRISMAGAGQSVQTMYLQMEVAKVFGIAEYKKLVKS
jgi:NitT/TauT family transport system substrate-binding protein